MGTAGQGFGAGRHAIEGIGRGGFLFGGASHVGSIMVLPSGVHAWTATDVGDIDAESLGPLFDAAGSIDFVLFGTGVVFAAPPAAVLAALKDRGLRFELMATSAAAQTYNILLAEDRKVAALLIAVP